MLKNFMLCLLVVYLGYMTIGIYDANNQVKYYSNARHKSFKSLEAAQDAYARHLSKSNFSRSLGSSSSNTQFEGQIDEIRRLRSEVEATRLAKERAEFQRDQA
ncbi:hypothetical protein ACJIZ3_014865 [Penstemon smallii]|uniref:Ribonuclease H1 N-terminal domain-containing protein n=1 Tax=Penstemon smallii TaxID=265156 RepID=A0ABD3RKW3_9LAMI